MGEKKKKEEKSNNRGGMSWVPACLLATGSG